MIASVGLLLSLQIVTSVVPPQIGEVSFLVGNWSGSVSGASVRLDVRLGPGRRSLRMELRVSGSLMKPVEDAGFLWWDGEVTAYRSFAMSSISNEPRREIGRLVDGSLVMVSEPFEVDGRSERTRRSYKFDANGLNVTLQTRENETWKTQVSVNLKKRS